jgi:Spy/CpxP family protein refolding chaperone
LSQAAVRTSNLLAALASGLALAAQSPSPVAAQDPPDPHCLSQNPRRLALTDDQLAQIRDIVRAQPESRARRVAILRVLTRTQWQVYWRTAGIAAC